MTKQPRDIYGRRPVSTSRGKTQERIMAMQHAAGMLPGTEGLLDEAPDGSIAEAVLSFLVDWVEHRTITSRRAYERALVLLVKDLAADGPVLTAPVTELSQSRLANHLAWRVHNGLDNPAELLRASVQLTRFADWADEHRGAGIAASRDMLRDVAERLGTGKLPHEPDDAPAGEPPAGEQASPHADPDAGGPDR